MNCSHCNFMLWSIWNTFAWHRIICCFNNNRLILLQVEQSDPIPCQSIGCSITNDAHAVWYGDCEREQDSWERWIKNIFHKLPGWQWVYWLNASSFFEERQGLIWGHERGIRSIGILRSTHSYLKLVPVLPLNLLKPLTNHVSPPSLLQHVQLVGVQDCGYLHEQLGNACWFCASLSG